ncbi:hypothetical protein [Agrobacterium burrii]|uniref:Uncharacterized protein n=1 Tax=Agrobacterium burrii TaxID=2815339 RepID=A0ABS3EB76_9HYPH|nr:hypothetical protein [Agrobacterium burrii]MBO0129209.1 hypothetical protein [Agrobacterium burrii]
MMEWKKSKKGSATIHKSNRLPNAIVDRRGYGIAAEMGKSITYQGKPFASVEAAKEFAERQLCEETV